MKNFVSAIIVAAGGSVRMGIADSKQFLPLLGKPAIDENGFSKVKRLIPGGASRAESVRNGISAADENTKYYAIHDGARPLITVEEIDRVTEAAFETGAATLGTSVTDTIKIVNGYNVIESTPLRSQLRAVQTPQVFEKDLYTFALENAGDNLINFTDDCSLIEHMGGEVEVVKGSKENIKLTTPVDVIIAESILKDRAR